MFLGIEIGGTKLQLVLGERGGKIVRRERLAVNRARGGEGIREQIAATIPKLAGGQTIKAAGVGFGGPVDHRTGKICCSHQIEGWSDFEMGAWVSKLVDAPARIDNDANTACLGEAILGAGRGKNPVFYVTMGSGVGGGLVVDGAIYHGAIPGEAEIGHVRLDRTGTIVEERCSGWAVDQRIRAAVQNDGGELARLCRDAETGHARFLAPALAANDPLARELLDETADDLAFALSHVTHLCHPQIIVLGGGLSLVGEPLRDAVAKALPKYTMHAFAPGPDIALASLGEDVVPCGALLLAESARA